MLESAEKHSKRVSWERIPPDSSSTLEIADFAVESTVPMTVWQADVVDSAATEAELLAAEVSATG